MNTHIDKKDILSREDLLFNPEVLQPLGTIKGVRNRPTEIYIDLNDLFLTYDNQQLLFTNLFKVFRQNGGKLPKKQFRSFISSKSTNFAKTNNLNEYRTAEYQATGFNNYTECLVAINNAFTKECYNLFSWNSYNPVRDTVEVGPADHRVLKKGFDMSHEDHGTLELWRNQFTQVLNAQFRNNNQIPKQRTAVHTRHYDTGNEGLRSNNPDRASLENPIYSYDMSNIYKNLDNYSSTGWYSM
jgi:hypothetical protein